MEEAILIRSGAMEAEILPMGCTLAALRVPDARGEVGNVVLAMDDWASDANPCMNCVIGRTAGRSHPACVVEGVAYALPGCDGGGGGIKATTCLHGGMRWNRAPWTVVSRDEAAVTLELIDPAGAPFPGVVTVRVTYALRESALWMRYSATTTATTPISLTQHAYWNLSAGADPTIDAHELALACEHFRPDDGGGDGLPTGARVAVRGTPRDAATKAVALGAFVAAQAAAAPRWPHGEEFEVSANVGTDWNADAGDGLPPLAAVLSHAPSGRVMRVHTTEPAIQTYYSTLLEGTRGPGGATYRNRGAICLEAQRHANAEAVGAPSRLLRPGATYRQTTVHVFQSS